MGNLDERPITEKHEFVPNHYGIEHICAMKDCHRYMDDPIHKIELDETAKRHEQAVKDVGKSLYPYNDPLDAERIVIEILRDEDDDIYEVIKYAVTQRKRVLELEQELNLARAEASNWYKMWQEDNLERADAMDKSDVLEQRVLELEEKLLLHEKEGICVSCMTQRAVWSELEQENAELRQKVHELDLILNTEHMGNARCTCGPDYFDNFCPLHGSKPSEEKWKELKGKPK